MQEKHGSKGKLCFAFVDLKKAFDSVLSKVAWLTSIFAASKYDHVTRLLCTLHWLRVPERIDFKIAVLVYWCLRGLAPAYLSTELQSVKDMPSRQRLWSWSSDILAVPMSRLSTVGDRAFPVIAVRVWNALPVDVISSTTLPAFKRLLKTTLLTELSWCMIQLQLHMTTLSDFRRDIVMWSCSYLAYAT